MSCWLNDTDRGDPEFGEEVVSLPISTTNPTWIDYAGTPGRRCKNTSIDRLSVTRIVHSV